MKQPIVDTHAHLGFDKFAGDLADVLARARAAGVGEIVTIGAGGGLQANNRAVRLAETLEGVWAAVGVHPHEARLAEPEHFEAIREWAGSHPRVVAIGETGLDYHYDFSPREVQRDSFRHLVRLAVEVGRPVVVHTREAEADTVAILREEGAGLCGGIIHCFAGTPWLAEQALELGFHLSFSGMLTYGWAEGIREVARTAPADRLLVETDAPYLPPAPRKGRNEPAFVAETLAVLARIRAVEVEEMADRTRKNAYAVFGFDHRS